MKIRAVVLLALATLLLCSEHILCQRVKSTLSGIVADPTGAVIPRAEVVLINEATNVSLQFVTSDQGTYSFSFLDPGVYSVRVAMPGFKTTVHKGIQVRMATDERLDVTLEIGEVTQEVNVIGQAPLLEKVSSTLGQSLEERKIVDLPIGRNVYNMINLLPGSSFGANAGVEATNPSINGSRPRGNSFVVDGVSVNQEFTGSQGGAGIADTPQLEAISEFRLLSSNYSAEHGRVIGGLVSLSIKSGSNQFHGSVFHYPSINRFNARDYFASSQSFKGKFFRNNRVGGSIGGPIIKDKLFFFHSIDVFRDRSVGTNRASIPTALMRTGDMSEFGKPIYDPATSRQENGVWVRDQFPGNIIPESRIDPSAKAMLELIPMPTSAGLSNNLSTQTDRSADSVRTDNRFDYTMSDRDSFSGRFSFGDSKSIGGSSIPGPVNNNASKEVKDRRPSFQISNTHTFTPQLVSETRVGYQRVRYAQWSDPEAYDDWRTKLGMPAIHADKKLQYGFPNINITGMTAWATPYDKFDFWQDSWNVNGTISLTQGKHLVKFGMSYFHLATVDRIPNFPAGGYYFNGQYTSLPGQANTGAPFADFLLGMSYLSYAGKVGDGMRPITHEWGFFIQDDFRIRPNLTLNLGLRYDMATPIKSTNNSIWTYEPSRNVTVPTDDPYPTDWNNLGPRVGLAWEVTPTLVLRTGYGISYFPQFKGLQGFAVFPPALEQHAYNSSNNPIQPARTFRDDFGTWLDLGNAKEFPLAVNNTVGMYITDNMDSPYMQSWNLTLEHQLGQSMVISASYVGNKGTHLESRVDLNQLPASLLGPNENFGGKTPQERKLYPGVNRVTALQNDSNSNYHALQMKFERRMAKGLTFLWSFTHSKAIDTFYSQIQDGWNRRGSRGVANWDVPNALVGSGLYEIPFLQDQRSIWGQIFGGWQANWVLTFRDGFPFSPSTNTNLSGGFLGSERRPDRIGSGVLPESQRTLDRWFDPTAFKSPEPYTYGNAGSNILRGPGFSNLDMSFFKKFRIHEGKTLEFRTNFSNFTNTPCFALPARVIEASNAGVINATSKGSRSVQFGLKFVF